ncbi:hypothetical protein [Priestia megaterium]|uniref:hypothetical protein n=1 Tax=Priestia megaterium TaxID=1404 RepID=UPI000BF9C3B8|nr:hypothetical protein [Priestia megaterium]PFI93399.1 hypothetical protein COI84_19730 [Priestia megaterium]PGR11784.1 hypothetical protein COC62_14270 [Priestia megaterium]
MSLQAVVEESLNVMTTDDKNTLINKVALIIDQVKEPATEDSYTKEQAFDRIVEEFRSSGVFG